jgi:acetyltransferase-like isoleucine patch superfamily enzyme
VRLIDEQARRVLGAVIRKVRPNTVLSPDINGRDFMGHLATYGFALVRGIKLTIRGRHNIFVMCESSVQIRGHRSLKIGRGALLERGVTILARGGSVTLGDRVVIGRYSVIEAASGVRQVGGSITVGCRSSFGDFCYVGGGGGVSIGEDVLIGQYVSFHSENHQYAETEVPIREQGIVRKGIVIGNNCWIGSGVRVLDGVTLASGSVVGAGAVVTRSTSPGEIVAGVPARHQAWRAG